MIVGLTGGIGCGKSTVAKIFADFNFKIFDEDATVHQCHNHPQVKQQLIELLGSEAYIDNQINRKFVADIVFNSKVRRQLIQDIFAPLIENKFLHFLLQCSNEDIVIYESALIFETGYYSRMDKIITVDTNYDLRISRLLNRGFDNVHQIEQRIACQLPQEDKVKKSDYVIVNNENNSYPLYQQVLKINQELKQI